jgi:nicotinamidase-related amidase
MTALDNMLGAVIAPERVDSATTTGGSTLPSNLSVLDGIESIDRSSMNAFEDQAFRQVVRSTGRKRLIIGGLRTEMCRTFATVQALKDGYDVLYVADAVGRRSQTAHRSGIEPLARAGAVPTMALAASAQRGQ